LALRNRRCAGSRPLIQIFRSSYKRICVSKSDALTGDNPYAPLPPQPEYGFWDWVTYVPIPYCIVGFKDYYSLPRIDDLIATINDPLVDPLDGVIRTYGEVYGNPLGLLWPYMRLDMPDQYWISGDTTGWPGTQLDPAPFDSQSAAYRWTTWELISLLPPLWSIADLLSIPEFSLDTLPYEAFIDLAGYQNKNDGHRPVWYGQQPPYPKLDEYPGYEVTRNHKTTPKCLLVDMMAWDSMMIPMETLSFEHNLTSTWVTTLIALKKRPRLSQLGASDARNISPVTDLDFGNFALPYPLDSWAAGVTDSWLNWQPALRPWLTEQRVGVRLPWQFFNTHVKDGDQLSVNEYGDIVANFRQSTLATTWTIPHNLGTTDFEFEATDIDENRLEPITITHIDSNTLELEFSQPVYGSVHIGLSNELDVFYLQFGRMDVEEITVTDFICFFHPRINLWNKSLMEPFPKAHLLDNNWARDLLNSAGYTDLPIPAGTNFTRTWIEDQVVGTSLADWVHNQAVPQSKSGTLDATRVQDMLYLNPGRVWYWREEEFFGHAPPLKRKTLDAGSSLDLTIRSDGEGFVLGEAWMLSQVVAGDTGWVPWSKWVFNQHQYDPPVTLPADKGQDWLFGTTVGVLTV